MPHPPRSSWISAALLFPAVLAWSAPPTIGRVPSPALTIGRPTLLVLEGTELTGEVKLLSALKIAAQKMVGTPAANRVEIEVTLDPATTAGIYPIRVSTAKGISNPSAISVDALTTLPFAPKIEALPIALTGNLVGPQVLATTFKGAKDQPLVIEVEAQRLGSNLRPVVRLYTPQGRQLAWSPPRFEVGGDARCAAVLPEDGEYTIEVHDQLYRAADPATFRLKLAPLQYAERTMPLAVQAGTKAALQLRLGNVTGPAEMDVPANTPPGTTLVPWMPTPFASGGAPRVLVSDLPEHVGIFSPNTTVPAAVSAVLTADGKEQTHTLKTAVGKKLRLSVLGREAGSPIDPVLTIRGEKGNQLAQMDDRPGSSDPLLDFTVPAGEETLVIGVKDMQDRGGPDFFYRLEVRDADAADVDATLAVDRLQIPAGGSLVLPLQLTRRNYDGPLTLTTNGLPAEIQVAGLNIPASATQALLSFTAPVNFAFAGTLELTLQADAAPQRLLRRVLFAETPGSKYQPWFRHTAGIAVAEASPLQLAWNIPADAKLIAGTKLESAAVVQRSETAKGNIRLRLLTTQSMPRKKIKENNQDKEVDDLDRALRIEGTPTIAADKSDAPLSILIPGDLALREWDFALVAELLSADGKNVIASATSPIRRFTATSPFTIELVGAPAADGRAGMGEAGVFRGKLNRSAGFAQPVVVTLTGLPKEVPAPFIAVAADKADFELPLRFPFASKPGELKDLKLVAVLDRMAVVTARSNEVVVSVNIVPGEKPAADAPKAIFDEDPATVALFNEGSGQATLENVDRYSGKIAVKVTPDQRFNAKFPGLSVKIRENPGPDEYRWLRFAWKKKDGKTIILQLNHDGMWGPGGSGKPGAKFRYHAGPAGEQYGGSVEVESKLPEDFVVVTRDLFADFGEFTLDGIALSPNDGAYAIFDHIYLGKTVDDLNLAKTGKE